MVARFDPPLPIVLDERDDARDLRAVSRRRWEGVRVRAMAGRVEPVDQDSSVFFAMT